MFCRYCKFWASKDKKIGFCTRIKDGFAYGYPWEGFSKSKELVCVQDVEAYHADLVSKSEFGCRLYKKLSGKRLRKV